MLYFEYLVRRFPLSFLLIFFVVRLDAAEPLDTVAKIRALGPKEAALALPVRIEGVVTYCDAHNGDMFVQDTTAGTYVGTFHWGFEQQWGALKPGDIVHVEGITRRGGFSTDMIQQSFHIIGHGPLPEPRRLAEDELLSPELDCQWVEVPALVVGVEQSEGIAFTLNVEVHGWKLDAVIPRDENSERRAAALMQRPVRLRGAVGTVFNDQGQMTGRHLYIPSFDQIVPTDVPAPSAPSPLRKVDELLLFSDTAHTLVRIQGVVTQPAENGFYLRDASGSTFVQSAQKGPFRQGTRVEAEGFASIAPFRPVLRARRAAILGNTEKPDPRPLHLDGEQKDRRVFQSELVTLEADFLARNDVSGGTQLQCRAGRLFFEAILPKPGVLPGNPGEGDHLRLTGICELTTTHPISKNRADGFRLHLPQSGGIAILHRSPWWTLQRVLTAMGIVSALAFGSLMWVWLLRRRVNQQTEIIGEQLKRVAVLDERQRIARELHDTVEQELTGVAIHLDSVAVNISTNILNKLTGHVGEALAQVHHSIQITQRMLQHCRKEARISIHDLRSIELEQRGLTGALRELLPALARECGAKFELLVSGEPHPMEPGVDNHLLRIAQESVANAVHHAAPSMITVKLNYSDNGVILEICDNGSGFDLAAPAPEGHFGILGIRERTKKIRAKLTLENAPGSGTIIRIVRASSKQP